MLTVWRCCSPAWGAVNSRLARRSPASYEDGVYQVNCLVTSFTVSLLLWQMLDTGRPSAREVSAALLGEGGAEGGAGSSRNRTAMLAFFGQVNIKHILFIQSVVILISD